MVMNGDSYCGVDFEGLMSQHQARNVSATIVTPWVEDCARYGSVALGPQDAIIGFSEKREKSGEGYVNGGIYVFSKTVLEQIPSGKYYSIERDVFPSLLGHGLYAFKTSGMFIDIGIPSELRRAQNVLKDHLGYP
jgi:NDP-sugar pyrophosphorylase family protein